MGVLDLFKKKRPRVKVVKTKEADELIEFVLSLIKNKEIAKKQVAKLDKIRKLPADEREQAYLSLYLDLEKTILQAPKSTKEYFSRKILKRQKKFTRESLRKAIKEKVKTNQLGGNLRVMFLDEPQRNLILYELMLHELVKLVSKNGKMKKILFGVVEQSSFFKYIEIENDNSDFSKLNRKIGNKKIPVSKVAKSFKNLFHEFYDKLTEIRQELVKAFFAFLSPTFSFDSL